MVAIWALVSSEHVGMVGRAAAVAGTLVLGREAVAELD
jgi:hypothetical protein